MKGYWLVAIAAVLLTASAAQAGDVLYDVPPALAALDAARDVEVLDDSGLAGVRGMGIGCSECKQILLQLIVAILQYEAPPCDCPKCPTTDLMDGYVYVYYRGEGFSFLSDGYWYCSGGQCMPYTPMQPPP